VPRLRHRVGPPCHHFAQCLLGADFSFCQYPVHGIAPGKDTDRTSVALGHEAALTRRARIDWQASLTVALGGRVTESWLRALFHH
jgi:hypothetical protein